MNAEQAEHLVLILINAFQTRNGATTQSIAEIRVMRRPAHVHLVWMTKSFVMGTWIARCK